MPMLGVTLRFERLALCILLSIASSLSYADRVTVEVTGVTGALRENVLLLLDMQTLSTQPEVTERSVKRAHNKAEGQIATALQPFGYYSVDIQASLASPDADASEWRATYAIALGQPVKYREVSLRLDNPEDAPDLISRMFAEHPFLPNQQVNHTDYSSFKSRVLDAAYDSGYLDSRFVAAELKVSAVEKTADVNWLFAPGAQYLFGEIDIRQQVLNDEILAKLVAIEAGEVFKPARLVDAQLALTDSAYFSTVEIDVHKAEAQDQRVPVSIVATPSPSKKYSTYFGYGTDTGPRLGFGAVFRHLNQRGHQFSADARLSAIRSTVATEYGIPIGDIKSERLSFFASAEKAEVGDADTDQFQIGSRIEDAWLGMRRQLYIILAQENFQFGDGPNESATILYPGMGLSWQRSDDPLFTRRGIALAFDVHGGDTNLLSDTTFVQTTLGANVVLPLGSRARLLLRGEVGATWAEDFSALPPSQRFFTGGDRTVRGYSFESLAPENAAGDEIGGEYLTVLSVETDVMLRGNYGLALFYDVGSASDKMGQALNAGIGIGFRYRSPVGLIRIDLAHPLDDPDTDFRLHLTFGPDL